MKLSPITKSQWLSVIRNAVFAAIAAAVALYAAGTSDTQVLVATAIMAALKVVEKAVTPAQ